MVIREQIPSEINLDICLWNTKFLLSLIFFPSLQQKNLNWHRRLKTQSPSTVFALSRIFAWVSIVLWNSTQLDSYSKKLLLTPWWRVIEMNKNIFKISVYKHKFSVTKYCNTNSFNPYSTLSSNHLTHWINWLHLWKIWARDRICRSSLES